VRAIQSEGTYILTTLHRLPSRTDIADLSEIYDQDTTEEVINTISVGVSIILDEESSGDAFDRDDRRLRGTKRGSQVT
jgi:hypothetical protein